LYFFALLSSLSQAVLDDNRQPNCLDWQCVVLFTGSSIYMQHPSPCRLKVKYAYLVLTWQELSELIII